MFNIIKKKFVKNYDKPNTGEARYSYGIVAGAFGILSNMILFGLKLFIGVLIGSISIIADAINNLSDAGSSVVTILGFRMSKKPADAEHPFGHARYEYITGFVVAFIVLIIGFLLAKSSIEKIINPTAIDTSIWAIIILVFAIAVKIFQGGLYKNFGKTIDSTALKATAADSRNDVITTSAVLISVIVSLIWPQVLLDGYIGVAVSVFIMISSIKLIKETIDPLLGTVPDKQVVDRICEKVLSYEEIIGIHDLMVYNYGPANCFATLHAEINANSDILVCHDIIDNIEREIREELNILTVIHMDPVIIDDEDANELKEKILLILRENVNADVTLHDFRLVRGVTHTNVLFDIVLPFGISATIKDINKLLTEKLCTEFNYYFIIQLDNMYV